MSVVGHYYEGEDSDSAWRSCLIESIRDDLFYFVGTEDRQAFVAHGRQKV